MRERDSSIDLLQEKTPLEPERVARQRFSSFTRLFVFVLVTLAIGGVFISAHIAKTDSSAGADESNLSLFSSFRKLVTSSDKTLEGEDGDRINVLLLGMGGAGHDGPELTDTIMFGSYQPSTHEVGIISIPRDLNVEIDGYGWRKINHVNALAEYDEPGTGVAAAKEKIGEILNENVNYGVKVDFSGFTEIIDAIGGVRVYVERNFTDTTYPLDDGLGSVKTVTFEEGWNDMDGETALIYARSRHGNNGEGTDFARAARQQKILAAVKEKALSLETLLNPARLNRVLGVISDNVETDLSVWEMMKFAKYIPSIDMENITMHVLDTSPDSPLYETSINGSYTILPKNEDWSDLHALADNIYDPSALTRTVASSSPLPSSDSMATVTVEVQNGTMTTGLAARTAELLQSSGFAVAAIGNAEDRSHETTIIYDFTNGQKAEELAALKTYLNATVVMSPSGYLSTNQVVPNNVRPISDVTPSAEVDFLIIIGENGMNLVMR